MRWPGVAKAGAVRGEPSIALDMSATSLIAAGIPLREWFHGRPLWRPLAKPRDFIVTARDHCDETVDRHPRRA